jgi:hypothetical protein
MLLRCTLFLCANLQSFWDGNLQAPDHPSHQWTQTSTQIHYQYQRSPCCTWWPCKKSISSNCLKRIMTSTINENNFTPYEKLKIFTITKSINLKMFFAKNYSWTHQVSLPCRQFRTTVRLRRIFVSKMLIWPTRTWHHYERP